MTVQTQYRFAALGLVALLLLSACGRLELGEFEGVVQTFEREAQDRGLDIKVRSLVVKFGKLERGLRAYCERDAFEAPTIVVNEEEWGYAAPEDREALLMHELGHCILDRPHVENESSFSLMTTEPVLGSAYSQHRKEYLDELFANRR